MDVERPQLCIVVVGCWAKEGHPWVPLTFWALAWLPCQAWKDPKCIPAVEAVALQACSIFLLHVHVATMAALALNVGNGKPPVPAVIAVPAGVPPQ